MDTRELILTQEDYERYGSSEIYKEHFEKYYNQRFLYKKELEKILDIMSNNDKYSILIVGLAGSGKTTFLNQLTNRIRGEWSYKYVYGRNVEPNYIFQNDKNDILLIDGLDEIRNPEMLLQYLETQSPDRVICTTRPQIINLQEFTHIIELIPPTLDEIVNRRLEFFSSVMIDKLLEHSTYNIKDSVPPRALLEKFQACSIALCVSSQNQFPNNVIQADESSMIIYRNQP